MDLMYISHANLLDDLFIMFATVKILFMPGSTEGVAEGQTTAMEESTCCDAGGEIKRIAVRKGNLCRQYRSSLRLTIVRK